MSALCQLVRQAEGEGAQDQHEMSLRCAYFYGLYRRVWDCKNKKRTRYLEADIQQIKQM